MGRIVIIKGMVAVVALDKHLVGVWVWLVLIPCLWKGEIWFRTEIKMLYGNWMISYQIR